MENSLKATSMVLAIFSTGLSAGLFYAWQISIIPGTRKISDHSYVEVMQNINREILNPWFFVIFFGSMIFLSSTSIIEYRSGMSINFWIVLTAFIVYTIGTFGVTAFGNVPLNDSLNLTNLASTTSEELKEIRTQYEVGWNRLHLIRTVCSVLSMALLIVSSKIN